MEKIEICNYNYFIGKGIFFHIKDNIPDFGRGIIVSDENVYPYYGEMFGNAFEDKELYFYVIKSGDKFKTPKTVLNILNYMAENDFCRDDCVFALGGGVVGDIAALTANLFMRGINFVNIPTTLLSAVDASIGGKTGVNLKNGKNLMGTFYRPKAVFCDTETFSTLPQSVYSEGFAEIIKYAVSLDEELFLLLKNDEISIDEIIVRCAKIKGSIVEKDEFDRHERKILNFGHTFAHAIESCSKYTISHGNAVAIGMVCALRVSEKVGYCDRNLTKDVCNILKKYELPTVCPFTAEEVFNAAIYDKKKNQNFFNVVVVEKIGKASFTSVDKQKFKKFIALGVE